MARTRNISQSVLTDAKKVCGSIYRMNAKTACGYAFTKDIRNKKVNSGQFIFTSELSDVTFKKYDGYISFENKTLKDLQSGQIINI